MPCALGRKDLEVKQGAPIVVRKRQALALLFTMTYFEAVRENGHKPGFVGKERRDLGQRTPSVSDG